MSLNAKILAFSVAMVLALTALTGVSIYLNEKLGGQALDLYDKAFVGVHYAHKVQTNFATLRSSVANAPLTAKNDIAAVTTMLDDMDVVIERATSPKEKEVAVAARADIATLIDAHFKGERPALGVISKKIQATVQRYADDAFERRNNADESIQHFTLILSATAAVCAAIMLTMAGGLILLVGRPLIKVVRSLRQTGKIDLKSGAARRSDEIGEMFRLIVALQRKEAEASLRNELASREERYSEIEAAALAKSNFLANMTHELRTPLNAIVGFAGLMKESDSLCPRDERHARLISDASETLLAIVNDVFDFSKLDAERLELEIRPFDPFEVVTSVVDMLASQVDAKGLAITSERNGFPGHLLGDGARLRQVLLNFVSNAIKFTSKGVVQIRVHCSQISGDCKLRVEVQDTGIGIHADQLSSIFDRFTQADESVSRRFGGTGLGLAISKRIVDSMGGTVGVESTEGEGSCFWLEVTMPIANPCPVETDVTPFSSDTQPLRVLLAEDNPVNRELICALLEPFDIEVQIAVDGVEAVTAEAASDFDLILMDVQMPNMDGLTATRRIRERAGGRRRVPIVAVTANILPDQIQRCIAAGMDGHLGKPISPGKLMEVLAHWSPP